MYSDLKIRFLIKYVYTYIRDLLAREKAALESVELPKEFQAEVSSI